VAGGVEVDIPFTSAPCAILVWGPIGERLPTNDASSAQVIAELDDRWDVDLIPTLDNRWGDFTFPPSPGPMPIQQWTFERVGGSDHGAPVIATFGPRAQWIGPGNPAELATIGHDMTWKTASWSLSRGVYKDPLHQIRLGPAGHVAEEFMDFGAVADGESIRFRSSFRIDEAVDYSGWFVIGAAAEKILLIDGRELSIDAYENSRYQTAAYVELGPGPHTVDILLTARHDLTLRVWMALASDIETIRGPDRLTLVGGPEPGTAVHFSTTFTNDRAVQAGKLQIGTRGPARIYLDNQEIGRQGGYLPYGDGSATQRYDIAHLLTPGGHTLVVRIDDTSIPINTVVDGIAEFEDGSQEMWLMTDPTWSVTRNGVPAELLVDPRPVGDPQLANLRQRPHPLPQAAWLEGEAADTGVVRPTAWFTDKAGATERLRCVVPPGAFEAVVPVVGRATASLDGQSLGAVKGTPGTRWKVLLPGPERINRVFELTVETVPGYAGGAVLTGPIEYAIGPGRMPSGNWEHLGLADYSGMVSYRQNVQLPALPPPGSEYLDLGHVRGSAEVKVNGRTAGTCVAAPFRFEITDEIRAAQGRMTIEIVVANTLGPYQQAASPTPFVFPGQTVSGLFGPVRIVHVPATH
jgi:hypothetical protein